MSDLNRRPCAAERPSSFPPHIFPTSVSVGRVGPGRRPVPTSPRSGDPGRRPGGGALASPRPAHRQPVPAPPPIRRSLYPAGPGGTRGAGRDGPASRGPGLPERKCCRPVRASAGTANPGARPIPGRRRGPAGRRDRWEGVVRPGSQGRGGAAPGGRNSTVLTYWSPPRTRTALRYPTRAWPAISCWCATMSNPASGCHRR